jgi:5-methylcytosine-specific restriction endonuclease McrA
MSNQFGTPDDIERKLRERDELCVYCGRKMKVYPLLREGIRDRATIEHFNWDGPCYWKDGLKEEDLAICCNSCNSSRGVKTLPDWFKSAYCTSRDINETTVAEPVKRYLAKAKA